MDTRPSGRHLETRAPTGQARWGRRIAVVALALAGCAALGGAWAMTTEEGRPESTADRLGMPPAKSRELGATDWGSILRQLSRRRSLAWQHARPDQLDQVFLTGSTVLERDRQALRSYLRRGITVDGAEVRFDRIVGLRHDARDRIKLSVVDRLAPVEVRTRDNVVRTLPRDRATHHTLWLRRTDRGWRIETIGQ